MGPCWIVPSGSATVTGYGVGKAPLSNGGVWGETHFLAFGLLAGSG